MPALGAGKYDLAVKVGEFVTSNGTSLSHAKLGFEFTGELRSFAPPV